MSFQVIEARASGAPDLRPTGAKWFTLVTAICSIVTGMLVILGWANGIEPLKRVVSSSVAMNPATAVCFILIGIALTLAHFGVRRGALLPAAMILVIGVAKAADLAGADLPIDQVFFAKLLGAALESHPNRMAPNTAIGFVMVGIALAFALSGSRRLQLLSQALAMAVGLIALFVLAGHGFNLRNLHTVGGYIPMAVNTGFAFLVVAAGTISLSRDIGVMSLLRDDGAVGSLSRLILPLAALIPVAIGMAHVWAERRAPYDVDQGVALMVVANVVVTCSLLFTAILALHQSDSLRKLREHALRQSEIFNRTINKSSPDAVYLLNNEGLVIFANEAAVSAYGVTDESYLLERPWGYCLDPNSREACDTALAVAREGGVGAVTFSLADADGGLRWFESLVSTTERTEAHPSRYIVVSRDITRQRAVEDQVRWAANHDSLTQLPNRALFHHRLEELLQEKGKLDFAIFLLDVDDFKQVNDTLGHDAGDALLCTVAKRLQRAVRKEDFVARLAGDEFAIILEGVKSEADAATSAERLFASMKEPWAHSGRVADCRVSIGASIGPMHGSTPSELLKNADIALYVAKEQERGRLAIFRAEMRAKLQKRSSQISLARYALQEELIVPFYQPKVELISGKLIGLEALLRWRHPSSGVQSPSSIEAAFQDVELSRKITDQILERALADMRTWLDHGVEFGHVALNAAAADFKQPDFAERVIERLNFYSIPPHTLQMEVTETVFLGRRAEYVQRALKKLSSSGIKIALDDFGTGYASLSHLKEFPVDIVKIDRSFLRDVLKDPHNAAIIKTVVSLGESLNLEVVAEGVETGDQEAYLIAQGCKLGQGYLYGKAVPASRVPGLIGSWSRKVAKAA